MFTFIIRCLCKANTAAISYIYEWFYVFMYMIYVPLRNMASSFFSQITSAYNTAYNTFLNPISQASMASLNLQGS